MGYKYKLTDLSKKLYTRPSKIVVTFLGIFLDSYKKSKITFFFQTISSVLVLCFITQILPQVFLDTMKLANLLLDMSSPLQAILGFFILFVIRISSTMELSLSNLFELDLSSTIFLNVFLVSIFFVYIYFYDIIKTTIRDDFSF